MMMLMMMMAAMVVMMMMMMIWFGLDGQQAADSLRPKLENQTSRSQTARQKGRAPQASASRSRRQTAATNATNQHRPEPAPDSSENGVVGTPPEHFNCRGATQGAAAY